MKLSEITIPRLTQVVFRQIDQTQYNTGLTVLLLSINSKEKYIEIEHKIQTQRNSKLTKILEHNVSGLMPLILANKLTEVFSSMFSWLPFNGFGLGSVKMPSVLTEYAILSTIRRINGKPILSDLIEELIISSLLDGQTDAHDLVAYLNQILKVDGYRIVKVNDYYKIEDLNGIYPSFSISHKYLDKKDIDYIKEMIKKCDKKLIDEDYEGAITNARTLLESVLINIENGLSPNKPQKYDGDIAKLFKRVRELLIESDPSLKEISNTFKQMFSGITSVISSLASMRNSMSDAHASVIQPDKKLARLAVNVSKTMADFLLEAYPYYDDEASNEIIDIDSEEVESLTI